MENTTGNFIWKFFCKFYFFVDLSSNNVYLSDDVVLFSWRFRFPTAKP
jgi:hypothetical protein